MSDLSRNTEFTDAELLEMIVAGGQKYQQASEILFHKFQGFIPKVQDKLHLSQTHIQDAYSDALVKLIRQIKLKKFRGESKLSTYFFSIFNNTAVDVSRKNSSNKNIVTQELNDYNLRERDLLQILEAKSEAKNLMSKMAQLGTTCQKILMDWGYYGYSMEEIAKRAKLANEGSARSMKFKCLKKLKSLLDVEA